jgi:hypothetical protein
LSVYCVKSSLGSSDSARYGWSVALVVLQHERVVDRAGDVVAGLAAGELAGQVAVRLGLDGHHDLAAGDRLALGGGLGGLGGLARGAAVALGRLLLGDRVVVVVAPAGAEHERSGAQQRGQPPPAHACGVHSGLFHGPPGFSTSDRGPVPRL